MASCKATLQGAPIRGQVEAQCTLCVLHQHECLQTVTVHVAVQLGTAT